MAFVESVRNLVLLRISLGLHSKLDTSGGAGESPKPTKTTVHIHVSPFAGSSEKRMKS